MTYNHNKGEIKESAVNELVTDSLFCQRIETPKKGKGSYNRKVTKNECRNYWQS